MKHHTIGNIPAYAGKTGKTGAQNEFSAEHPRVCGENVKETSNEVLLAGTSPRMRGKPFVESSYPTWQRNIPAYAGKTFDFISVDIRLEEHPRVCGENYPRRAHRGGWFGTSPRMRGKPVSGRNFLCLSRNIPAYAGKTRHRPVGVHRSKEHPRVCGENNLLQLIIH